jgi:hypothetical protein
VNAQRVSVAELLESSDPLSDEACTGLLHYREEDGRVDFKISFDAAIDKSWIDLAIDCVAFANTDGGYIVLGVADKTWNLVGLDRGSVSILTDTKKVLEKINRSLIPALTQVRTRAIEHSGMAFVVIYSPCSPDCTHIFESNLDWNPIPTKTVTAVTRGAIYVRRVASNQLLTSIDFELLLERRLKRIRNRMLEGVARVIQAPVNHEIVTVVRSSDEHGAPTMTISDAPDSMELRGKLLRIAKDSIAEKISWLKELTNADARITVPASILYEVYADRETFRSDKATAEWLAYRSLLCEAPVFWWLRQLATATARKVLKMAFEKPGLRRGYIARYSGFYGEAIYTELRDRLKGQQSLEPYRDKRSLLNADPSRDPSNDARRATELVRQLAIDRDQASIHELERLDCSLYAPFS